jgi:WD40 repeat protein
MLSTREADWDACRSTLEGHSHHITAVVFSPDRQLVTLASGDNTVQLWEAATGTCCSTLEGHSDYVTAVAFLPDGQLVTSASGDKTVRLWEAATGTCRSTLEGHSDYVTAVAFSPCGQVLHTNTGDTSLSLPSVAPSPSWQQTRSFHILLQGQWILCNQQRFLWLPPNYRPSCSAVHKNIVCLALLSGCIAQLRID